MKLFNVMMLHLKLIIIMIQCGLIKVFSMNLWIGLALNSLSKPSEAIICFDAAL